MMRKRILSALLAVLLLTVTLLSGAEPVQAIPSGESLIKQLGGPIGDFDPTDLDSLMEKYNTSEAYEARFYPFGQGNKEVVFLGTAHYVRDLKKTDLEIAYQEALRKSGTDRYSLERFYKDASEYEATSEFSAEDLKALLGEAASTAGVTYSAMADKPNTVVSLGGIAIGTSSFFSDVFGDNVNLNTVVSGVFTLGDIIVTVAEAAGAEIAGAIGSVAAAGSIAWNTFWKYIEHQENWKDFVDYLNGRRNLLEFYKWLEAELAEAMKKTTGWDIQFNEATDEFTGMFYGFEVPITLTMNARFLYNYVPEFSFGTINATNPEGWAGNLEIDAEADMSGFQAGFPGSPHDITQFADIFKMQANILVRDITKFEDFFWNSNMSHKTLPLKAGSMDMNQSQIVFTGSLADGSYTYQQGGRYLRDYLSHFKIAAEDVTLELIDYKAYGDFYINHRGTHREFDIYEIIRAPISEEIMNISDKEDPDVGDIFWFDYTYKQATAKMVIDISKPKK